MKFLPGTITALTLLGLSTASSVEGTRRHPKVEKKEKEDTIGTPGGLRRALPEAELRHSTIGSSHNGNNNGPDAHRECSRNKKITLYRFCIEGDQDQGQNGEHKLILGDYTDGETKYREDECHDLVDRFHPQHLSHNEDLVVGTIEVDTHDEDDFILEMHPDRWYIDTCHTYQIALSNEFEWRGSNSWSGCWYSVYGAVEEAAQLHPPHLNQCPDDHYDRPDDSFTWYLRIEPDDDSDGHGKVNYPPGWHDSAGKEFDCVWYSQGNRCEVFGGSFAQDGYTAKDACTACGGGVYM